MSSQNVPFGAEVWLPLCMFLILMALLVLFLPSHLLSKHGHEPHEGPMCKLPYTNLVCFSYFTLGSLPISLPLIFGFILTFELAPIASTYFQLGYSVAVILWITVPSFLAFLFISLATGPLPKTLPMHLKSHALMLLVLLLLFTTTGFGFVMTFRDSYASLGHLNNTNTSILVTKSMTELGFALRVSPFFACWLVNLIGVLHGGILIIEELMALQDFPLFHTFFLMYWPHLIYLTFSAAIPFPLWIYPENWNTYTACIILIVVFISQFGHFPHHHYMNICLDPSIAKLDGKFPYSLMSMLLSMSPSILLSNMNHELPASILIPIALMILVPQVTTSLVCLFWDNRKSIPVKFGPFGLTSGTLIITGAVGTVLTVCFATEQNFASSLALGLCWAYVILSVLASCYLFYFAATRLERSNLNIMNRLVYTQYKCDTDAIDNLVVETNADQPTSHGLLQCFLERSERFGMTEREFCGYYLDRTLVLTKEGQRLWKGVNMVMTGAKDQHSYFSIWPQEIQKLVLMMFAAQLRLPMLVWGSLKKPVQEDVNESSMLMLGRANNYGTGPKRPNQFRVM